MKRHASRLPRRRTRRRSGSRTSMAPSLRRAMSIRSATCEDSRVQTASFSPRGRSLATRLPSLTLLPWARLRHRVSEASYPSIRHLMAHWRTSIPPMAVSASSFLTPPAQSSPPAIQMTWCSRASTWKALRFSWRLTLERALRTPNRRSLTWVHLRD